LLIILQRNEDEKYLKLARGAEGPEDDDSSILMHQRKPFRNIIASSDENMSKTS
jgi:hypothetical protein